MKQLTKLKDVAISNAYNDGWFDLIENDGGNIFWSMIERNVLQDYIEMYLEQDLFSQELFNDFYHYIYVNYYNFAYSYYIERSYEKYISPLYQRYIEKLDFHVDDIDLEDFNILNDYLARTILTKFLLKWVRIFNAIITDYKPLENYNMEEVRTPDIERSRSGSESGSHTERGTDSVNTDITNSKETSTEAGIYGFNSSNSNPSASGTGDESVRTTGDKEDNYTERTSSGSKNGTHSETETETGTETLRRHGNIGVTTSQQMLESEIKLRQYNFVEQMFNDIDSVLCLKIY